MTSSSELEIPIENEKSIFGSRDRYIRQIEKALDVSLIERNGKL